MPDAHSAADRRLDALFSGSLAHCRDLVSFGDIRGEFQPVARLVEPGGARAVLEGFRAGRPDADERACASLWTQWYTGAVVVPVAAMALGLRRVVAVPVDEVGVRIHPEEGRPSAVRLPGVGLWRPEADAFTLLESLVHEHLRPLVAAIAAAGRLPERVLWGNVGASLHWTIRQLPDCGAGTAGSGDAGSPDRLFTEREWPDRRLNPIFRTMRPARHGGSARRGVCCLRYRIPGLDRCDGICPARADRRSAAAAG